MFGDAVHGILAYRAHGESDSTTMHSEGCAPRRVRGGSLRGGYGRPHSGDPTHLVRNGARSRLHTFPLVSYRGGC